MDSEVWRQMFAWSMVGVIVIGIIISAIISNRN
jgi:hypothetical protein